MKAGGKEEGDVLGGWLVGLRFDGFGRLEEFLFADFGEPVDVFLELALVGGGDVGQVGRVAVDDEVREVDGGGGEGVWVGAGGRFRRRAEVHVGQGEGGLVAGGGFVVGFLEDGVEAPGGRG